MFQTTETHLYPVNVRVMKSSLIKIVVVVVLIFAGSQHGWSQGAFVNLDFESANVPFVPAGQFGSDVTVSQGLPGWNAYYNAAQANQVWHNNLSIGEAAIIIYGPQWNSSSILQGQYTAYLGGDYNPSGNPSAMNGVAIGQTGQIPQNANSLVFYSTSLSSLQATFAGQQIPVVQLGAANNYIVLGGDISAFAGQTGELRFSAPFNTGGLVDNIQFSTAVVPEPGLFGLFALGSLLLGWRMLPKQQ